MGGETVAEGYDVRAERAGDGEDVGEDALGGDRRWNLRRQRRRRSSECAFVGAYVRKAKRRFAKDREGTFALNVAIRSASTAFHGASPHGTPHEAIVPASKRQSSQSGWSAEA